MKEYKEGLRRVTQATLGDKERAYYFHAKDLARSQVNMLGQSSEYRKAKELVNAKKRQLDIERFTRNPSKWDDKPMSDPATAPVLANKDRSMQSSSRIQSMIVSKRKLQ